MHAGYPRAFKPDYFKREFLREISSAKLLFGCPLADKTDTSNESWSSKYIGYGNLAFSNSWSLNLREEELEKPFKYPRVFFGVHSWFNNLFPLGWNPRNSVKNENKSKYLWGKF